jgi:hypothetical protein
MARIVLVLAAVLLAPVTAFADNECTILLDGYTHYRNASSATACWEHVVDIEYVHCAEVGDGTYTAWGSYRPRDPGKSTTGGFVDTFTCSGGTVE